jgi:hypothetical protein
MIDHHGRDPRFVTDLLPTWICSWKLFGEHQQLMEKDKGRGDKGGTAHIPGDRIQEVISNGPCCYWEPEGSQMENKAK